MFKWFFYMGGACILGIAFLHAASVCTRSYSDGVSEAARTVAVFATLMLAVAGFLHVRATDTITAHNNHVQVLLQRLPAGLFKERCSRRGVLLERPAWNTPAIPCLLTARFRITSDYLKLGGYGFFEVDSDGTVIERKGIAAYTLPLDFRPPQDLVDHDGLRAELDL